MDATSRLKRDAAQPLLRIDHTRLHVGWMSLFTSTSNRRRWVCTRKQNARRDGGRFVGIAPLPLMGIASLNPSYGLIERTFNDARPTRSQSEGLIPRTITMLILDPRRQAHYIEQFEERFSRQLFNVGHACHVPVATRDQQRRRDRRYACGVGDALTVGLDKGILVVGDVVDKQLGWLAVFGAFNQITNAGLTAVARCQRSWSPAVRP